MISNDRNEVKNRHVQFKNLGKGQQTIHFIAFPQSRILCRAWKSSYPMYRGVPKRFQETPFANWSVSTRSKYSNRAVIVICFLNYNYSYSISSVTVKQPKI